MSDNNNVTVEGSILADEIEVVCGEERDNNICGKRVGVVKQTQVGAMFVPVRARPSTWAAGRFRTRPTSRLLERGAPSATSG